MNIKGKTAVVTGAGTGIGAALARALSREGARVVLVGRRAEKLDIVAKDVAEHLVIAADVGKHGDLARVVTAAVERFGGFDILVNNAGVGYGGAVSDVSPEEIDHTMRVNLVAPMWLTQLALPELCKRPESMVVNVSSLGGIVAMPNMTVYCASKFGLNGYTRALRRELRGTTTRVLAVYPGTVDTELNSAEVRAKVESLGMTMEAISADRAANDIVRAIKGNKESVLPGTSKEKMLPALNALLPFVVDRVSQKLAPVLREGLLVGNKWSRGRNEMRPLR